MIDQCNIDTISVKDIPCGDVPNVNQPVKPKLSGAIIYFEKTIYDFKRKSKDQVKEIIRVEIEFLLRQNPLYKMDKASITPVDKFGCVIYTFYLKSKTDN